MPPPHPVTALVAAVAVESEAAHHPLLHSVVGTARTILSAQACSILLVDESSGELVFEAVSGQGEGALEGRRFPATSGVAGWVLTTREPLFVQNAASEPLFAQDVAQATGYVPASLLAAPLLRAEDGDPLGVLEVLDPGPPRGSGLGELELLALFAEHASLALGVLQRGRAVQRTLAADGGDLRDLVALARALDSAPPERRAAGLEVFAAMRGFMNH